jgi:phosphoribosylaminoimidazole-succinocarboxamide synthase
MKEALGLKFSNNQTLYEDLSKADLPFDGKDYQVVEYPDHYNVTANKKVHVKDLGEKFASINGFFMDYLKEYNIPTAFLKNPEKNKVKFIKHKKFPFSIRIINLVDKRTAKIFSKKEGEPLTLPVFEIHYGDGKESLITESHLITFELCTNEDIKLIIRICSKINAVLKSFFERRGNQLAEVNCWFGKSDEKIFLVDDFTPRSLKALPLHENGKAVDPYKFGTSAEIRHYTDHLHKLTSA